MSLPHNPGSLEDDALETCEGAIVDMEQLPVNFRNNDGLILEVKSVRMCVCAYVRMFVWL